LLLAGSNNLALATILIKDLHYTVRDFAPVGAIARVSYALAVRPAIPATTIAELVAHARAHPGELNYGSSGVGSTSSLGFELLKRAANVDIVHIPYKGSAVAVGELVSGRIDIVFADLALLAPLANDGSLRLIAVAGTGRSSAASDVRTVAEQGYPELAVEPWYGIVVPAGTPNAIVEKLSIALVQTLRTPAVRQRFDRLGYSPIETNPEQLAALIRTEIKTFEALVGQIGIEAQR
jgi:tripartite-type tricarboxylate transporter receptor subunit TctC